MCILINIVKRGWYVEVMHIPVVARFQARIWARSEKMSRITQPALWTRASRRKK